MNTHALLHFLAGLPIGFAIGILYVRWRDRVTGRYTVFTETGRMQAIAAYLSLRGRMGSLQDDIHELTSQRDGLIKALNLYQSAGFGNSTDFAKQAEAYDAAIEAIAKAEAP